LLNFTARTSSRASRSIPDAASSDLHGLWKCVEIYFPAIQEYLYLSSRNVAAMRQSRTQLFKI
jgi:hypothetical protein